VNATAWTAIAIFAIAYALIATEKIHRVAVPMLLNGATDAEHAFFSEESGIDNIPYVATISPLVADLVNANGNTDQSHVLWWSLALGADLGGNATAVGASANVVILGLAERAGKRISFWEFTKCGLAVAFVTVAVSMPYLWLRYFVFDLDLNSG
jgi:Na+/H+ antiporter NhaD/arsenite permease-like protein